MGRPNRIISSSLARIAGEDLIDRLLSAFPHGAVDWSAVCDCAISSAYSLTLGIDYQDVCHN